MAEKKKKKIVSVIYRKKYLASSEITEKIRIFSKDRGEGKCEFYERIA